MFIILDALKWILFEMKKKIFYSGFRQFWWGDWRERRNQECLHSLPLRKEEHHQSHQRHEENEVQSYTHCGGHTEAVQRHWGRNTGLVLSFLIFHEQYLSTSRESPALASNAMQINTYLVRETSWVEHLVVVYVPLLEILLLLLIHVFFKNLFALF